MEDKRLRLLVALESESQRRAAIEWLAANGPACEIREAADRAAYAAALDGFRPRAILGGPLPDAPGRQPLRMALAADPLRPFLALLSGPSVEEAVGWMRDGAADCLALDSLEGLSGALTRSLSLPCEDPGQGASPRPRSPGGHDCLLEDIDDAVYILDSDGVFLHVNRAAERMYGHSRETIVGRTPEFLAAPERNDLEDTARRLREAMEGRPQRFDFWGLRADGSTFPKEVGVARSRWRGRDVLVAVGREIGQRQAAEEALRSSEQFLQAVLDSSPFGVSVRDSSGKLLSCNRAWQRIWNLDDDTVASDRSRVRSELRFDERDDYLGPWRDEIGRVYRVGGRLTIPELKLRGQRTRVAWVAQHFYAILGRDGAVDRVVVITQDISEQKAAEEALRASEAHYREFFEHDLTADYVSLPDGSLVDCNPAYVHLFGFASREEALACSTAELYPDGEARRIFLDELMKHGKLEYREAELRRRDGQPIFVIVNTLGTFDAEGRLLRMRGYLFDVTQHKLLQRQFFQAQKMESIGRLAGGVAHDFNNLLTVINGNVELVLSQLRELDPARDSLEQVAGAGARAARLTRQLLAFSRRQVLQLEPVDLNRVVSDLLRMLERLIGEDVRLRTRQAANLPRVMADSGQLEQVLVNLSVNSRDAMPGGGTLSIETDAVEVDAAFCREHSPMRPGHYCRLRVADTGEGMSAETLGRIFEPFFTTKDPGKGTGLGLATVYGIVKQSGGFIWADSAHGKGTTFDVYLPACEDCGEEGTVAGSESAELLRGRETVLLVEDELPVRRLAARLLTSAGYSVIEAGDGQEALRLFDDGAVFDLLLTDVVMPHMNGTALAERLLERMIGLPVLFMSGYMEDAGALQDIQRLGRRIIQKPFELQELLRQVRAALEG